MSGLVLFESSYAVDVLVAETEDWYARRKGREAKMRVVIMIVMF